MGILNGIAQAVGKKLEEIASALGLPASAEGAEDKQVAEAIMCLAARAGTLEGEIREIGTIANVLTLPIEPAAVKTNVLSLQASRERILGALRVTLCLGQDADETAVLNSVQTLQAESRNRHAVALIGEAVASGRLPPALREFFINSACADLEATRQCLNALPPLIPGRSTGNHRSLADQQRELSEGEQNVCRLLGLSAGAFLYAESMTRQ